MKFYVYTLVDPRTNKPFYVGKGCGERDVQHLKEAARPRNKQINKIKCNIINNILSCGMSVTINRIREGLTEQEAYDIEAATVALYGKIVDGTGCLANISDGGKGGSGTNTKHICQYTQSGAFVQTHTSLTVAAVATGLHISTICAALNGRTLFGGGFQWRYIGEPPMPHEQHRSTPVDQYSMSGTFVRSFDTVTDAAVHVGLSYTQISECANYATHKYTAGGYRWARRGEVPKPIPNRAVNAVSSKTKQYVCYDSSGAYHRTFNNLTDAVAFTPANKTGIIDCCAGRKRTSGGFMWISVSPGESVPQQYPEQ